MTNTIDYRQAFIEWRTNQHNNLVKRFPNSTAAVDFSQQFHCEIKNNKKMLVTLGDSWTWGASLEAEHRLQQIYGSVLQCELNSDWINIGCCGFSNSFILENLTFLLPLLKSSKYDKIFVVVTLTENGRDLQSFPSFRYDYKKLQSELGLSNSFYETVLVAIENHWIKQLQNFLSGIDSRFTVVVGQNFVWHASVVEELQQHLIVLQKNWIECLAQAQNLNDPLRTTLVTGFVFDHCIESVHDLLEVKEKTQFKKWALPYLDKANSVNAWLDNSPMNYKKASKHPNAEGHQIWADYIRQHLE